jgi:hypothetical protein
MSITRVKSYSTANIQGENLSNDTAILSAQLAMDKLAIIALQQSTTGIAYASATDLTTVDINVTVKT